MQSLLFTLGIAIGLRFIAATTIGPTATLDVANTDISPDGFSRSAVLVNGVFPAPVITGNMGDTFSLTVNDQLTDDTMELATSIHWHGLYQSGTNYQDGVAFVNQCPIIPGNSYNYNFATPDQAGTFWYHSHLNTQYCDGLRGAFVIYDPNDPNADLYDVDDEGTIIQLSDWYHTSALADIGTFPTPDSNLINGLGRYSGGNTTSPLAVVSVTSGTRYRMRLINNSCHPYYNFTIDGHTMTIIEADGQNTEQLTVDLITIQPGQRYSFILNADQDVDNYWIRASPNLGSASTDDGINAAILRYDGAADADPTSTQDTSTAPLAEWDLSPLSDPAAPGTAGRGNADVNINLGFAFGGAGVFSVNGTQFVPPSSPVLLQILSGATNPADLLPAGSIYSLPSNSTIELSMPAQQLAGAPHPFHLHGHSFSVIRSANSNTDNYVNPVRRDVVSIGGIYPADNVTIRFTTDNPGPWFLHCHIDWHLQVGLAVVFVEDIADVSSANTPTSAWSDLCPDYTAWGST